MNWFSSDFASEFGTSAALISTIYYNRKRDELSTRLSLLSCFLLTKQFADLSD